MGWEADQKEKREHDLEHYCNSKHHWSFFNFCRSQPLFEKTPIFQALSEQKPQDPEPPFSNQLNLFDL